MSSHIIWKRRPEPTLTNNQTCNSQRTNPAVTMYEPYATYSPGITPTSTANKRNNKHHSKASNINNTEHKQNVANSQEEVQPSKAELQQPHNNDNNKELKKTAVAEATDTTHNQSNTNWSLYNDNNVHETEIIANNNTQDNDNIVAVKDSSEEDKEFARIEREARIALECIAARDVDVEVQMPFYVEVLRQYRTMCESRGLYKEAHILQQVLRHLRLEEETRHVRGMTAQQMAERNTLDEMHREAFRQFHKEWNEKIDVFEEAQLEQETALLERQNEELESFYNEMNGFHPHILRYSKRLIELRCKQHHLARQRDYLSAHEFKQRGDEVEVRDGNVFNSIRSAMYGRRERALQHRHEQELKALRMKVNERRCALERQRKQQLDELLQRYINVRREMEMQHRVVRSKTGNVLLKHACNLKSDWSGSAALVESVESGAFGSIIQRRLISETRITPPPPPPPEATAGQETVSHANNEEKDIHHNKSENNVMHAEESFNTNVSTDTIEKQTSDDVHWRKGKSPLPSKEQIQHGAQKEELESESEEYEYVYEEEESEDDQSSKHSSSVMRKDSNVQQTKQVNDDNNDDDKAKRKVTDEDTTEYNKEKATHQSEKQEYLSQEELQRKLSTDDKVKGETNKQQLSNGNLHDKEQYDKNEVLKKEYDQYEQEQEEHHKEEKIIEESAKEGDSDGEYEEYEELEEEEVELSILNEKYAVSSAPSSKDKNNRTNAVKCKELKSVEEEQHEEQQPKWLEPYPTENAAIADAQKEPKMYITEEEDVNSSAQMKGHSDISASEANEVKEEATEQNEENSILAKLISNPEIEFNDQNDHMETAEKQSEEYEDKKQGNDEANEPEWLELQLPTNKTENGHNSESKANDDDNEKVKTVQTDNNSSKNNRNSVQDKEVHALSNLEESDSKSNNTSPKKHSIDDEDDLHKVSLSTEHEKELTQQQVEELANPQWLELEEVNHANENLQEPKEYEQEQLQPEENERQKWGRNVEEEQEEEEYEYEYEEEEEQQHIENVNANAFPVEEDNKAKIVNWLEPEFLRNDDEDKVKEHVSSNTIESTIKNTNIDLNKSGSNNTSKQTINGTEHSIVSDNITAETRVETTVH